MVVLDQLPDKFKSFKFDGFYKMMKSVEIGNPGTTHNRSIAIYDRVFGPPFSISRVATHELAHVIYYNLPESDRKDYKSTLGWGSKYGLVKREGPLVTDQIFKKL